MTFRCPTVKLLGNLMGEECSQTFIATFFLRSSDSTLYMLQPGHAIVECVVSIHSMQSD